MLAARLPVIRQTTGVESPPACVWDHSPVLSVCGVLLKLFHRLCSRLLDCLQSEKTPGVSPVLCSLSPCAVEAELFCHGSLHTQPRVGPRLLALDARRNVIRDGVIFCLLCLCFHSLGVFLSACLSFLFILSVCLSPPLPFF